ncbi:MAG: tetratricopeptide repeat protein [Hahellaceae bacterium]|nr:tetratricopeptide repeat protein [Hahellaceae bacterium]
MLFKSYQRKHFLIIDDFDNFIISLKQMLRRLGAEDIDSARNGDEAIQMCIKKHYDVVFCDYNMGDSHKNGQQVLEELRYRRLLKNMDLFIMVSAEAGKDMVFGALEYQPDGYITKPITQSLLQNRLDKMIEQKVSTMDIERAMDEEDFAKAITLTNTQLKIDPKNRAWLIRTLGRLYHLNGDYAHAKKVFQDVLKNRPVEWARMGLAKALFMEGNVQEASALFDDIVKENAQNLEAYDWLAKCQKQAGQTRQAQETLKAAVAVSPRAILRQLELAGLSKQLNDLDAAAKAFKASVKLGDKSCYETPEMHLDYSKTLTDLAEANQGMSGVRYAQDAVNALENVRRKYHNDNRVQLLSHLVEVRAQGQQNNTEASAKALKQAQKLFVAAEMDEKDADIVTEMAHTLFSLGQSNEAESLLHSYAARFPQNTRVQAQVEELLEEPVSLAQRMKAREFNRQGIQLYEQGKLEEALAVFNQALAITPKHSGLNLNFLQALLKLASQSGGLGSHRQSATDALDRMAKMNENHRQYKRYQHLLGRFQALKSV